MLSMNKSNFMSILCQNLLHCIIMSDAIFLRGPTKLIGDGVCIIVCASFSIDLLPLFQYSFCKTNVSRDLHVR